MKAMIEDVALFIMSLEQAMKWDFDRIIVSHGEIIETGGKEAFQQAFKDYLRPQPRPHHSFAIRSFARCG